METIKRNIKWSTYILTIISIIVLIGFVGKSNKIIIGELKKELTTRSLDLFGNSVINNKSSSHTVKYYLENPLGLPDNIVCDGFYDKGDIGTTTYKKVSINGTENFSDIGNGVLIGSDGSIKVGNDEKLLP